MAQKTTAGQPRDEADGDPGVEGDPHADADSRADGEPAAVAATDSVEVLSAEPDSALVSGISDLTYEQAREELITIVAKIESGDVPLEESMRLWERGEALAAHCQAKLDAAQEQLDKTVSDDPPASG